MSVLVRIPMPLRSVTKGQHEVRATGTTVGELVEDLGRQFPELRQRLLDDDGRVRRFINVFVNEEDIRFLSGPTTPVNDGDQVSIIPALAGG